jgi:hypothetical protein
MDAIFTPAVARPLLVVAAAAAALAAVGVAFRRTGLEKKIRGALASDRHGRSIRKDQWKVSPPRPAPAGGGY